MSELEKIAETASERALFDSQKVWVGITPTGWVNDDFPWIAEEIPFEQCVSEIALAGFQGCSVGHKYPKDVAVLKRELELRSLRVSEPWVSLYFTANEMAEKTVDSFVERVIFMEQMGGDRINVAELGHSVHLLPGVSLVANKPHFTGEQWEALVEGLHRVGKIAVEHGMVLSYHHHMGTGVQTRNEVDRLMDSTDAELVHLLLDTGHLYWAGDDPLDMAETYADRIKHVHLKDVRQEVLEESLRLKRSFYDAIMAGIFTVPGDGAIDFKPILQALALHGYEGWLVVEAEQDPHKANPLEYAKRARTYLQDIAGL
jgi:inosose dehydratase